MSQKIPSRDESPNPVQIHSPRATDMYAKREKIHPRFISGFFQNIRFSSMTIALGIFLLLPWMSWDGRQALLFDLPHRQFHIFSATFAPQDFFLLSWLMIIAAFSLFVVTVFAGRVFCGYACPQTTWTALFMWIEKVTEGERNARIKLDKAGFSAEKVLRRTAKHFLWLLVALVTGFTFVGYFTPVRELLPTFLHGALDVWGYFFIGLFTVMTYMNAGWLREQVCFHMCPYGRFQSVMFDRDTLIVSYDKARGEARGSRKKEADPKALGLGDCIDCYQCVQVCPTGIDIRDGLQLECIQCAACVDACDSVMDKMGYERGLVRYTTENLLEHKGPYHWLRPRLIGYAALLIVMTGLFFYSLATRVPLSVEAVRDRNQLYVENSEGLIENVYTLKILNKSQQAHTYQVVLADADPNISLLPVKEVSIEPGEMLSLPVTLQADPGNLRQTNYDLRFAIRSTDVADVQASTQSRFIAPHH